MAGASQSMTVAEFQVYLGRIGEAASKGDRVSLQRRFGIFLANKAKETFHASETPDGVPWEPLAARTIAGRRQGKRKGGTGPKPLIDTGLLMGSLIGKGGGHVERADGKQLEWGTNVLYAGFHQFGTSRIPARPFLGLTDAMMDRIGDIAADWAQQQTLGA